MQQVSPWPESFDVSEPVARVLIDGQEVNVESVSVSSELDSAMPERVAAGGGGVVAATGNASILRADDVAEAGFNPWGDAQRFVNASEVVVEAGYRDPETGDVGCARQITGQVESLDGGATSNSVGLEFVDYTPLLDRNITIEPLLQEYPSLEDWGPRVGAGLYPTYITDRVLRHCGFYATPPMIPQALVSAPLMGSAVPERGTLFAANAESASTGAATFRPTAWGMGLGNGVLRYAPNLGSRGHARLTSTLHVSFHRHRSTSPDRGDARITLRWGSVDDEIRIDVDRTNTILVRFRGGGVQTTVAQLPVADTNASEAFTVTVTPAGEVTLYASNGATATGSIQLPSRMVTHNMDEIRVTVPRFSHPIGGLQVAFSDTQNHLFQRTAHIDAAFFHSLLALPLMDDVNCLTLLKEQAEAELAAMWIDEFGHFWWRSRHELRATPPMGTLTSQRNLLDLSWQIPARSVYSRVELEREVPAVTYRNVPSITVSDNRGSTLSNEDTEDRFFEPPADQDWHQVQDPRWMGGSPNLGELKRGRGSYRGGVVVDDDENERISYSSRLDQSWHRIGPQKWLLSSRATSLGPDEFIEQRFLDRPDLYGRFAGENLPILRAKALTQWETETTVGASRGPTHAPVFTHHVGPWVQGSGVEPLVEWLAEQLTKPDVILRDVPIVPDPRVQLGDVFWLEDTTAYHVRLRVVVMGKTLTYQATNSGHEMSQTITCRVIDLERLDARYDELEAAWAGRNYTAFTAAWSGQDYDALEADPLDRS